jgi:hypothetical protein
VDVAGRDHIETRAGDRRRDDDGLGKCGDATRRTEDQQGSYQGSDHHILHRWHCAPHTRTVAASLLNRTKP